MRGFKLFVLFLALAGCARAQYLGNTGLQTVEVPKVLNAVAASGVSANIQNLGQTIHILNYTVSGSPTLLQIRLEGSFDGSTWIPISDDATDLANGEVIGLGFYPAIRANLVQLVGAVTVTANYSGHFAGPSTGVGFYNPSQQIRKVVLTRQSMGSSQTTLGIAAPFGSTAGYLLLVTSAAFPGGSTINVTGHVSDAAWVNNTITPVGGVSQSFAFPISNTPATSVDIAYLSGGASANVFSAYYIFTLPGAALPSSQPALVNNSEATATNATVTTNIAPTTGNPQRANLYSLSARCAAGTAGLTVKDGATTIWSSGPTEVGTTTFRYQWNPALAGSPGNTLAVALTTCGAANVGTLDVQGSIF